MARLNISELEQVEKFRHLQLTLRDRWKTSELFDNSESQQIYWGDREEFASGV
jgi:hypothetical protein